MTAASIIFYVALAVPIAWGAFVLFVGVMSYSAGALVDEKGPPLFTITNGVFFILFALLALLSDYAR